MVKLRNKSPMKKIRKIEIHCNLKNQINSEIFLELLFSNFKVFYFKCIYEIRTKYYREEN